MPLESIVPVERNPLSGASNSPLRRLAASPSSAPAAVSSARATAPPPADTAPGPWPDSGVRNWSPGLNQQLATAQQSQDYLEQLQDRLLTLKGLVSRRLASSGDQATALQNGPQDAPLARRRDELKLLWQQRPEASGGGLDAQLGFDADGTAPQRFRVRGLDARTLQSAGSETLAFSVPGARQQPASVRIDPNLSLGSLAQCLDQALAPIGVRVKAEPQASLVFQTSPAQWERLSEGLMVKGDGKRFPTGQPVRVQLDPTPALINPALWQLDSPEGLRQVLPEIVRASRQVEQTQSQVQRSLDRVDQALEANTPTADARACETFATQFAGQAAGAQGFAKLAALVGSAQGLPRHRVESLLKIQAES